MSAPPRPTRLRRRNSTRTRFVAEAVFLVVVAGGAALAGIRPLGIVLIMGLAWIVVAAFERLSSRDRAARAALAAAAPVEVPRRRLRRRREPAVPSVEPPEIATRPLPELVDWQAGMVQAPGERSEPDAIAVAEPVPPPAPLPAPPEGAREWNLWELERLNRKHAGRDAERDEERGALLMHLRDFANADGNLPPSFDPLVRESFADLFSAAR